MERVTNNFLKVLQISYKLTVKTMAGRGVCRLVWIMARNLGRCPSRAEANTNLRKTKTNKKIFNLLSEFPCNSQVWQIA